MKRSKNKKLKIQRVSFPKQTDDFNVQKQKEYGFQVAKAIQGEWFKREGTGHATFYDNRHEFRLRRSYARGENSTNHIKKQVGDDGDISYINLDDSPIPIVPKFADLVANGMSQREYTMRAFSIDRESTEKRIEFRESVKKDMATKEFSLMAKDMGVDTFSVDPKELPQDENELDIYTEIKYKPAIEIAEESAVSYISEENEYNDVVRRRIEKDLTDLGIGACKSVYSYSDGIKIEYVDPENIIWSYTEDPYFKDLYYVGEFKNELISNIIKENPHLNEEERERIQEASNTWAEYHGLEGWDEYDDNLDGKIAVLNFSYKTVRKKIYKEKSSKTKGRRVLRKEEDFEVKGKGDRDFKKITKYEEVWFEGSYVLGTDILLKWELAENQVRPKSNSNRVLCNYAICAPNMYKNRIDSLVKRMIPFADKIKAIDYKIQQTIQMMVPDGQFIDVDGLAEIDLGDGGSYSPQEAFDLYMKTGSIFGRSQTYGGEFNHGKVPIQEITTSGFNNKLNALERQYLFNLQQIRDITGINEAVDASNPDKDALVGIQKMMAYNSNVATRHILEASKYITKKIFQLSSYRISDVMEFSETKKDLKQKIGSKNVRSLEFVDKLHLHDFAIYIDLAMDDEEKAILEQDIALEIQNGTLGVEDKIDIMQIKNLKYANEILKLKKKRREQMIQERKMEEIEAQKQANIESAQASAQAKQQEQAMKTEAEFGLEDKKHQNAIQKMTEEYKLKNEHEEVKASFQEPIKQQERQERMNREEMKEKRKDDRVKKQASTQSKLIEQRKSNTPAIDFEEADDELAMFDIE